MKMKVKGHNNLLKDAYSGAILNTDIKAMEEYKIKKAMLVSAKESKNEIDQLKERLDQLETVKQDLEEIKNMLKGLVK